MNLKVRCRRVSTYTLHALVSGDQLVTAAKPPMFPDSETLSSVSALTSSDSSWPRLITSGTSASPLHSQPGSPIEVSMGRHGSVIPLWFNFSPGKRSQALPPEYLFTSTEADSSGDSLQAVTMTNVAPMRATDRFERAVIECFPISPGWIDFHSATSPSCESCERLCSRRPSALLLLICGLRNCASGTLGLTSVPQAGDKYWFLTG